MAWNNTRRATSTHTAAGGTKHSATCEMAFGRKDATCPRCQELLAGSAPRESFHAPLMYGGVATAKEARSAYCTCGQSQIWHAQCPSCGRPPYTD